MDVTAFRWDAAGPPRRRLVPYALGVLEGSITLGVVALGLYLLPSPDPREAS